MCVSDIFILCMHLPSAPLSRKLNIAAISVILVLKMSQETIDRQPTMKELTAFPIKSRGNIIQEIGVKYQEFGAQLVHDPTGSWVTSMELEHRGNSLRINTEIIQKWLRGHGRRPISWKTLIEVLQDIEMSGLAGDIEEALLDNDNYHTFEVLQDIEMGGDTEETCLQYNGNLNQSARNKGNVRVLRKGV